MGQNVSRKKTPNAGSKMLAVKQRKSSDRVLVDLETMPSRTVQEGLPPVRDHLGVVILRGKEIPYACGHTYAEEFIFDVYGMGCVATKKNAKAQCGDCLIAELARETARCALCHHVIFTGDPVALYAYVPESFDPAKSQPWFTFVEHDEGGKSVVGCLRAACCPSGGFFAGRWTANGFKGAYDNGASVASETLRTGKTHVVSLV